MKFSTVALFAATAASAVKAADAEQVAFLTAIVGDYNANKRQYLDYFQSASNVPSELTNLALQVRTYTDNSYTTLLDNAAINVPALELYATNLPWYTRIKVESAAPQATSVGASVAEASGVSTGSGSGARSSGASATAAASSSRASSTAASLASSSTKNNANPAMIAPLGAVIGAAAIVLM